jgi:hypothetical protein
VTKQRFYPLAEGFTKVIKKDITNKEAVYLREDVFNGVLKPYTNNMVGKYRIGIKTSEMSPNSLYKWVYCADLCKKIS